MAQVKHDLVLYDGDCALCHGFVRFVLYRDHRAHFRFAPLAAGSDRDLNSFIVETTDGRRLLRSDASLHVMSHLGGFWALAAWIGRRFPLWFRDAVYRFIARIRFAVFGRAKALCPIVPVELRGRFLKPYDGEL